MRPVTMAGGPQKPVPALHPMQWEVAVPALLPPLRSRRHLLRRGPQRSAKCLLRRRCCGLRTWLLRAWLAA